VLAGAPGNANQIGAAKQKHRGEGAPAKGAAAQRAAIADDAVVEDAGQAPPVVEEPTPAAEVSHLSAPREVVLCKRAEGAGNAEKKWFFLEHFKRSRKTYEDVTSDEQAAEYEAEYKSKYSVLLELYKTINVFKAEVMAMNEEGLAGESSIRRLWEDESEYLLGMDAAFKLLRKELSEMKAKAKVFWRSRRAGEKRKRVI
jgi:hypothetical protein